VSDAKTRKRENKQSFAPLRLACVTAAVLSAALLCRTGAYWVDGLHRWAVSRGVLSVGETSVEEPLSGDLLDKDTSDAGTVLLRADGTYRTVLTVQNDTGQDCYHWYSATTWLTACALGDGEAAAAGVDDTGTWQLLRLNPTVEEPLETMALDGVNAVYDLRYLDDTLCAVTDEAVLLLRDGQLTRFLCGEVLDYAFGSDFAVILEPDAVRLCTADGETTVFPAESAEAVLANGRYWAVLTPETATVYTARGRRITSAAREGSSVALRTDGGFIFA
jgi:hypothetical protein